jgi:hypothetical protein
MNTTSARLVSVLALGNIFQELVANGEMRQIEFRPEWAGATGYFEKLFKYERRSKVDVKDGELVLAVGPDQRWLLIGRYLGEVHMLFQRYTAKPDGLETAVIYASSGTPNALATLLELNNCSLVSFDTILQFIGAFDEGQARALAIADCLTMDVSDIFTSADGADVTTHSAVEPATVNQPTNKETAPMSNAAQNTVSADRDVTNIASAPSAQAAAAQAAAAGAKVAADAASNATNTAPISDAGKTRSTDGRGEITVVGYSTAKKVGLFSAGVVTGAAATVGGYLAWNKWFR